MTAIALPWRDDYLFEHFARIDGFLRRYQALWRPQAFQYPRLPWAQQYSELAQLLRGLNFEHAQQLAEDDGALAQFFGELLPDAAAIYVGCALPSLAAVNNFSSQAEARSVPGRKWQQINAFAASVPDDAAPLLEWCAGKAHLGRLLAKVQQRNVVALEWHADLVAAGAQLAQREKLPVQLQCIDVLAPESATLLQRETAVVALHACGQLHERLLRVCALQQPRALTLAPCCYHLIATEYYAPLSRTAIAAQLSLSVSDLHTAVRDSVTSPQRVQQQRKTLQAWRLGFDIWQREVRGVDNYLPTPSQPLSVINNGFRAFCAALAALNNIDAPPDARCEDYERVGWRRLHEVAAFDLPRMLFRRPLELWLLLDRALFLREHGYSVELGTFCERSLTPRNVAIRALRTVEPAATVSERR